MATQPGVPRTNPAIGTLNSPILVWMLYVNHEITEEEYRECFDAVTKTIPHCKHLKYNYRSGESVRILLANMMPLLMMRHRRIPRSRWRDHSTPNGKHWIEQMLEHTNPEHHMRSMIGYHLAWENSLIGMAMVQGRKQEVVNIGIGVKELITDPPNIPVKDYVDSLSHKLTEKELGFINPELSDEVVMRRLAIVLSLKAAYIRAIGQPLGFDYARLEFNIPEEKCSGDGEALTGWEFRLFRSNVGVQRNGQLVEELYQCCVAFFRGTPETRFHFSENKADLESWVQFINMDQMVNVIPKLAD